jgi:hypothetical protein
LNKNFKNLVEFFLLGVFNSYTADYFALDESFLFAFFLASAALIAMRSMNN